MVLVTSATTDASATSGDDILTGTAAAQAFVIDNSGSTGKDTITAFGRNDSLLFTEKLYDSNGDGIITFGGDKRLDTSYDVDGLDEINVIGVRADKGVRYLGEKDGYFVYADATVKPKGSIEGTVGNDTLNGTAAKDVFFYDTALGLNLGDDTISGFGADDVIVTTSELWDSNGDGTVKFGGNGILNLPGAGGGASSDPSLSPGGSIDFGLPDVTELHLLSTTTVGTTTYYYYGL